MTRKRLIFTSITLRKRPMTLNEKQNKYKQTREHSAQREVPSRRMQTCTTESSVHTSLLGHSKWGWWMCSNISLGFILLYVNNGRFCYPLPNSDGLAKGRRLFFFLVQISCLGGEVGRLMRNFCCCLFCFEEMVVKRMVKVFINYDFLACSGLHIFGDTFGNTQWFKST